MKHHIVVWGGDGLGSGVCWEYPCRNGGVGDVLQRDVLLEGIWVDRIGWPRC